MNKGRSVRVRLDEQTYEEIRKSAPGGNVSRFIRNAIQKALEVEKMRAPLDEIYDNNPDKKQALLEILAMLYDKMGK